MKSKMKGISQLRQLTINGETKTVKDWAKLSKVHPATVVSRLGSGWMERDAVWVRPGMPRPVNGDASYAVPVSRSPLDAIKMELARLKDAIAKNRTEREALRQEEVAMLAEVKRIAEEMANWQTESTGIAVGDVAQAYAGQ